MLRKPVYTAGSRAWFGPEGGMSHVQRHPEGCQGPGTRVPSQEALGTHSLLLPHPSLGLRQASNNLNARGPLFRHWDSIFLPDS